MTDKDERIAQLEQERDEARAQLAEARERIRACTQQIIEQLGARGPESLEQAVNRAIAVQHDVVARANHVPGLSAELDAVRGELTQTCREAERLRGHLIAAAEGFESGAKLYELEDAHEIMRPLIKAMRDTSLKTAAVLRDAAFRGPVAPLMTTQAERDLHEVRMVAYAHGFMARGPVHEWLDLRLLDRQRMIEQRSDPAPITPDSDATNRRGRPPAGGDSPSEQPGTGARRP